MPVPFMTSMSHDHSIHLVSGRKNSEDRAAIYERDDALALVVADGAGGFSGGSAAADTFVLAVATAVGERSFDLLDLGRWRLLLARTDAELAAKRVGETTAVVVVVSACSLVGVSVGDSEAWVVTASGIDDLTANQSRRRLGTGRAEPTHFVRPALDGVLVVGTDGLFKYATRR